MRDLLTETIRSLIINSDIKDVNQDILNKLPKAGGASMLADKEKLIDPLVDPIRTFYISACPSLTINEIVRFNGFTGESRMDEIIFREWRNRHSNGKFSPYMP